MRILHLTLTKQWFDMIASGAKKEEYREIKPYWISRLTDDFIHQHDEDGERFIFACKHFDIIRFRNGYAKDAPEMDVVLKVIRIKCGVAIWGAEQDKKYFALQLGKVLTIKNYKP